MLNPKTTTLERLRQTRLYHAIKRQHQFYLYQRWVARGRGVPLPHVAKQKIIGDVAAERRDLRVFVETGTYFGDMVHAVRRSFAAIYSIELSEDLHAMAKRRFSNYKHIHVLQGDSGELLGELLQKIDQPCLFWLDGHYSAGFTARGPRETPIERELEHIARHRHRAKHVILVDDARCFNGTGDYPKVERLRQWALSVGFDRFQDTDDILRISSSS